MRDEDPTLEERAIRLIRLTGGELKAGQEDTLTHWTTVIEATYRGNSFANAPGLVRDALDIAHSLGRVRALGRGKGTAAARKQRERHAENLIQGCENRLAKQRDAIRIDATGVTFDEGTPALLVDEVLMERVGLRADWTQPKTFAGNIRVPLAALGIRAKSTETAKAPLIGVGSLSPHKTGATEDALLRPGHAFSGQGTIILPHDARSGIDAQPFGAGIAGLGAERRAFETLDDNPELDYAVGIENFLELVLRHWLDIPMVAIAMRSETGHTIVGVASGVGYPIPLEFVLEAMAAGFDLHTAGEFLAAKQRTEDKTDPVAGLTGRLLLRRQLIADAIYAALIQVPKD